MLTKKTGSTSQWYLVSAQLPARTPKVKAYLIVQNTTQTYTIPLSVSFKGRLLEVVRIEAVARITQVHIELNNQKETTTPVELRQIAARQAYYHMWRRIVWTWHTMDSVLRRRVQFYKTLCGSTYKAYRLLSSFRYHYPAPSYTQWLQQYWYLQGKHKQAIHQFKKSLRGQFSYTVLIDGTNASKQAIERSVRSVHLQQAFAAEPRVWLSSQPLATVLPVSKQYVLYIKAGCVLKPAALAWFIWKQKQQPQAACIYSDHDILDEAGAYSNPCFKPDWSMELQRSTAYVSEVIWVEQAAFLKACQCLGDEINAYALVLELAMDGPAPEHIPAVLWSMTGSLDTVPLSKNHQQQLAKHLARHCISATVSTDRHGLVRVLYTLPAIKPLVSIIIPTRDMLHLLQPCIQSILLRTQWEHYEIIVVDNQSTCEQTLHYMQELVKNEPKVRVLSYDYPFNYSAINNYAVSQARGEFICLLNNDTEVISPDWLDELISRLLQPQIGVVGARLYYTDGRVQHAGDVVGVGGCAAHLYGVLEPDDVGYMYRAVAAQNLSAVTAACLVTPKSLYERLGGLNATELTVAFNDVDYCLRVQEAGYQVIYTPYAELYHHESVSRGTENTPAKKARAKAEADYMRKRWAVITQGDPFYNPNLNFTQPDFSLAKVPRIDWPWGD